MEKQQGQLIRSLTLTAATILVVSSVIGSGVYKKVAPMSADLMDPSLLSIPVIAAGVIMHLLVIAPQRRRSLVAMVAGVALLGVVAMMGANWLQNKRATNQLYLSALFPPGWRLAPTVPLDQFMREAASIRQRLDERLKDHDEDAPGDDEED